jgi:thiol-disulfide isomerase/thioredoxin
MNSSSNFEFKRRALLLAGLGAAVTSRAQETKGYLRRPWPKGQATPPLDLPGYEAPRWNLKEAQGKLVLLNFWATWCEPCRSEMPTLELLATRFEKQGLIIVAVNQRETDAAIKRFMDVMPISLPIVRDSDGATSRAFGVRAFPTSVLVGRDGRALFSVIGEMDWNGPEARQWISTAL